MHVRFRFFALLLSALIPFAAARAADAPTVSHDGLELVKSKKVDTLYRRPGARLAPYKQVALLDCEVAFRKAFTEELGKGGYAITDKPGDDVLVVRPAIIGLDIAAPDVLTAGRTRSYATSAGEMTLYVELYDGATGEIIARVVDRRNGRDEGRMMWQTAITNRADADRMLRKWAVLARESLDEAKAGGEGP